MSTEPAKPDASTDIGMMSLEAVQAELRSYEPSAAVQSDEHRERRKALWARLDQLTGSGAVTPTRGVQQA
jgi:hypothetical protein